MLSTHQEFQKLLLLHGRDRRFQKLTIEIDGIPQEQIKIKKQIDTERQSVEMALNDLRELETENNFLEKEILSGTEHVNKLKSRQLEVKKNEEYSALESEISTVLLNQSQLEDNQLEVLMKIDDARKIAEIAESKINLKISQLEKDLAATDQRSKEIRQELLNLEQQIQEARNEVELQLLSQYDRTKTVISKPPFMAPVTDQRCSGCNLRVSNDVVSSILVEKKITNCDQCGRIVYIER